RFFPLLAAAAALALTLRFGFRPSLRLLGFRLHFKGSFFFDGFLFFPGVAFTTAIGHGFGNVLNGLHRFVALDSRPLDLFDRLAFSFLGRGLLGFLHHDALVLFFFVVE